MLRVCRGPGLPRLLPAAAVHSFVDVTPKLPNVSMRCITGGVVAERGWAVYTLVSTVDSDEGCAPVRGEGGSVQCPLLLCVCPQYAGHPVYVSTIQAAPCGAHAVTSQYSTVTAPPRKMFGLVLIVCVFTCVASS
jgi:hypothetical protein